MNSWIYRWRANAYANVQNVDLFTRLDALTRKFRVRPKFVCDSFVHHHPFFELILSIFQKHVLGHTGVYENEKADELAKLGASSSKDFLLYNETDNKCNKD
jgi:ribonuclease HI